MHRFLSNLQFQMIYSGVLTVLLIVTLLWPHAHRQKFDQIDVQRINVAEPDGTLRLVIHDKAVAPGTIIRGKEHPSLSGQKAVGLAFYDDEGTESGGLVFRGEKGKDGKPSSHGHLSFDRYDQDQLFSIDADQEGDAHEVGISIVDQPDYPLEDLIAVTDRTKDLPPEERRAEITKFVQARGGPHPRAQLFRADDGSVELRMMDTEGRARLLLGVGTDGAPVVRLLDESGKVIGRLPAGK